MTEALIRLHAIIQAHRFRWLFMGAVPWLVLAAWGATTGPAAVLVYVAAAVLLLLWLVGVASGIYLVLVGLVLGVAAVAAWRAGEAAGISGKAQAAAAGGLALLSAIIGGSLVARSPTVPVEDVAVSPTFAAAPTTTVEEASSTAPATTTLPEVASVIDGETFQVVIDGEPEEVRIIGIDAPKGANCLADEAVARLAELLSSGFELRRDVSNRDASGRLLRHVDTAEGSAAERLVEDGLAVARRNPPDVSGAQTLDDLHRAAQAATAGIWNWFTCGAPSLQIEASGSDLLVRNTGTGILSLDGLSVIDGAAVLYEFPPATALLPEQHIIVSPGCGADESRRLKACVGAWPAVVMITSGETTAVATFPTRSASTTSFGGGD